MEQLFALLKEFTQIDGVSGDESRVREAIIHHIKEHVTSMEIDPLGNLLVFKEGKKRASKKIMVEAHMDEVGFMVSGYQDGGLLYFTPVGGLDVRVMLGKRIRFPRTGIKGILGCEAIHLTENTSALPKVENILVDIGAKSKEEAEKLVRLGDYFTFDSAYLSFGEEKIKAKALDDRVGCAILTRLLLEDLVYDAWFAFNVQEEVGLRGATASAYTIAPDYAIVVEATTAADLADIPTQKQVCNVGRGAVLSLMDSSTVYDPALVQEAFALAEKEGIQVQAKRMASGGNDAGAIHKSRGGVKTVAVSLPCRYIHSGASVCAKQDILEQYKLVKALLSQAGA